MSKNKNAFRDDFGKKSKVSKQNFRGECVSYCNIYNYVIGRQAIHEACPEKLFWCQPSRLIQIPERVNVGNLFISVTEMKYYSNKQLLSKYRSSTDLSLQRLKEQLSLLQSKIAISPLDWAVT